MREIRKLFEKLVFRGARSQIAERIVHCDASIPDARLPAPPAGFDRYPPEQIHAETLLLSQPMASQQTCAVRSVGAISKAESWGLRVVRSQKVES
jgi:hypothetical protein